MFKSLINWLKGVTTEKDTVPNYMGGSKESKPSITNAELKKMTKKQIDDWAAEQGVTLDRRLTKDKMIAELKNHVTVS